MKNSIVLILASGLMLSCSQAQQPAGYKNPLLTVEERTRDLLSRMTLEEKVGQLLCPLGWEMYEKQGGEVRHSEKFEALIKEKQVGMLWATFRADPWTKKTIENGLNPALAAEAGNALQRYVMENTRLGIPLFLAEECPHGHMAIGTTVFPTGIGQAATWNPALIEEMAAVIAKEVRLQGGHIGYGPVLDLSRDPRWSRVEESYGEDPVLTARMGSAFVKGAGAGNIGGSEQVIVTLKHFVAYGIPEGGHNGNTSLIGERELRENFLPPFQSAINAGALSVMTAYNSIDGVPCTANRFLLTDVLRGEWNFQGFSISDLGSIEGLASNHFIAETTAEAAIAAVTAGLDADLGGGAFTRLIAAVRDNKISEAVIDTAVCRILRLKFRMRLFENPYVEPLAAKEGVRCSEHTRLARKVARESIVLLKNKDRLLPLGEQWNKIAVIGPNADNIYNMLGDYTAPQEERAVTTILEGIRAKRPSARVEYVKGCAIRDTTRSEIDKAVRAALNAGVVIVVVGGSSARDFKTNYIETGAAVASRDDVSDMESGEGFDRVSLNLLGHQQRLLQALKATGRPLVVVYIQGRPLNMNWAAENADALLTAWYPGQEGGTAVADALFGDYNPAGRLPISVPRHVGQLPVYYNKKNPRGHDYVEMTAAPLYPFGYGLSYTVFEYGHLEITPSGNAACRVSLSVKNTGTRDGDEVVQLYLRDEHASTVQPVKQLKHFERVHLKKGEERKVTFSLSEEDFSIIDRHMKRNVEAGRFTLMVGASSKDIRLTGSFTVN